MYTKILQDSSFYIVLKTIDQDIAAKTRDNHCQKCAGHLHVANYHRKPRGEPKRLPQDFSLRYSFCCSREGCRIRTTPPSVRFMGRRVWLAPIFIVAAMLMGDSSPKKIRHFMRELGVSYDLVRKWRKWWQQVFSRSQRWTFLKGWLAIPVCDNKIPETLLAFFQQNSPCAAEGLVRTLNFLNHHDLLWS